MQQFVWCVHRQDSKGRERGGLSDRAGNEIRAGRQPQDGEGTRSRRRRILSAARRRGDRVRRRNFIALLGGAAAWPLAVPAQQPGTPVIGFVSIRSADDVSSAPVDAFRQGVIEAGYVPGQDVAVENRWGRWEDGESA